MIGECCGGCCFFLNEDIDGFGICPHVELSVSERHCSDECSCGKYVSYEQKRRHMAVLRRCQRSLRSADNKDMDVKAVREAIDFIVEYSKLF